MRGCSGRLQPNEYRGVGVLVVRDGKTTYYEAFGQQNPARDEPMRRDSIFRIYSMTKPIVSVVAMMLVEEGAACCSRPQSCVIYRPSAT